MLKINILNVSVWVLAGILLLVAIGLLIWRFVKRKDIAEESNSKVGSVSKEFNDFIISQATTTDNEFLYNILIKNKFANKGFSLIPAVIFSNNRIFLSTNLINTRGYDSIKFTESDTPILTKRSKTFNVPKFSFKWSKEIMRYLEHEFPEATIHKIALVSDQQAEIINERKDLSVIRLLDFEEDIQKLSFDGKANDPQIVKKLLTKLSQRNQFKSTMAANNKKIRAGKGR